MSTADDSAVASTSSSVVPVDCSGPSSARRLMPEQDAYRRWLFTKDYLDSKVPTVSSDHALAEDELRWRQKACSFIQAMGELLNRPIKDATARGRVSQNCLCAAMVHMHRFFVFHSFKRFNCQDIAAACLFLAAKSEECPRKLDHVVRVWHSLKAKEKGQSPLLETKTEAYMNAMNYIVTLENTVLQTLAFDLQVELPHVHVVTACKRFLPSDKMMTETAYYFATDVLLLTNLCVREKAQVIACVCISLVSNWRNYEVPDPSKEQCWFQAVEPTLSKAYLHALTLEVAKIYVENRNRLNLNLFSMRNYLAIGDMNVAGSSGTTPPRGGALPEPPMKIAAPPGGQQVKAKIDLTRYYQRHSLPTSASSPALAAADGAEQPAAEHVVAPAQPAPARKSFIPDLNKIESEVHQELRRRQAEQKERRRLNVHPPLPAAKLVPFSSGSAAETAAAADGHQPARPTAETNAQILKRKADESSRKRPRNEADKSEQPATTSAEQPAATKRTRTTATAGELSDLPPPPPPPALPSDKRKHHHHALHQHHKGHHHSEREKRREEERRMRRQPPVDVRKRTAEIGAKFADGGENEKQPKQRVDSPLAKTSSRTEAERCAVVLNSADHRAHPNRPPEGKTASASGDMRKLLNKLTGASCKLSPTADKQQQHRKAAVGDRSTPPPAEKNGLEKLLVQKDGLLKEESERKMEKLEKIRAAAAKAPEDLEEGEIDD